MSFTATEKGNRIIAYLTRESLPNNNKSTNDLIILRNIKRIRYSNFVYQIHGYDTTYKNQIHQQF